MKKIPFPSVKFGEQLISLEDTRRLRTIIDRLQFGPVAIFAPGPDMGIDEEQLEFQQVDTKERRLYTLFHLDLNRRDSAALMASPFKFQGVEQGVQDLLGTYRRGTPWSQFLFNLPGVTTLALGELEKMVGEV